MGLQALIIYKASSGALAHAVCLSWIYSGLTIACPLPSSHVRSFLLRPALRDPHTRYERGVHAAACTAGHAMELTLRVPVKNIPWRNNNLSLVHTEPPLSEQGETVIGVYLLVLGKALFGSLVPL